MIRKSKPEKGNKFYNTISNGGLSKCIKGKPTVKDLDVLCNCVGAMNGWFAEGTGLDYIKYQFTMNAGKFVEYAKKWGLEVVQHPVKGAIACFKHKTGAGHVFGVVDYDDTFVYTAESGYNSYEWKNKKRRISNNYDLNSNYTLVGFIKNPYIKDDKPKEKIKYQTYDNKKKKWLSNVVVGSNNYAGIFGDAVGGLYLDKYKCRVHLKNEKKWLSWVQDRNDYAGIKGKAIDGVQIEGVKYRVHIKGGKWLNWINKVDNTSMGYAGIYGKVIDAIQIKLK